ncbi:phage tail fiber protein [Xenorhabdus stockiae]|uniref:phage tail fiber protein n=1 Tax=Xenorhabdus stockiae TaxID=351614 RepID=UPI004062881F
MIYTQGTLSTVSGSTIVRGTGTKFKDNLNGVAPGQVILIQSGSSNLLHMIQAVNSDTELVLADNVNVTLNNVTYQIQTTVPNSISDGVRHMCAINSNIIQFLQNMDQWMTQNGAVEVTLPNGQTVSLQSIKAMNEAIAGKLDKDQNGADIPNTSAFVGNLGLTDTRDLVKKVIHSSGNWITVGDESKQGWLGKSDSDIYIGNSKSNKYLELKDDGQLKYGGTQIIRQGDFGVGSHDLSGNNDAGYLWNVAGDQPTGFYSYTPKSHQDEQWGSFIKLRWNEGNQQYLVLPNFGADAMRIVRYIGGDNWSDHTVWTTGNTTVDGSGYLKKASPIIQIHPTGKFSTNDESEGATVSTLGLGHYQVMGVLGYNADKAWGVHGGISSPKNNNGLELIYIDDKVNKDGSITIETFHRQHSHLPARFQNKRIKAIVNGEKVYYQDGEPCDIPEGCRLDVRVQMPANSVWNVRQKVISGELGG